MDPYKIIQYPLSTEKVVREMESANSLLFVVAKKATKAQIKWAVEKAFEVKVTGIRTVISPNGKKKAYVKLSDKTPAIDVASKLGLM